MAPPLPSVYHSGMGSALRLGKTARLSDGIFQWGVYRQVSRRRMISLCARLNAIQNRAPAGKAPNVHVDPGGRPGLPIREPASAASSMPAPLRVASIRARRGSAGVGAAAAEGPGRPRRRSRALRADCAQPRDPRRPRRPHNQTAVPRASPARAPHTPLTPPAIRAARAGARSARPAAG
jgi:hypothetical protein